MLTNRLICLTKVEIIFKIETYHTGSEWQAQLISVNALILVDTTITEEKISEQLGISLNRDHKTVQDDLADSKHSCQWFHQNNAWLHTAAK